jgi:MFS family permease
LSQSNPEAPPQRHDPLAALRQRSFQLYSLSRIFGTLGQTSLQAVLAWQVYDLTGSALSLGLLGLARFIPAVCASLIGGTVADTYDRRRVILTAQLVPLTCAIILAFATVGGWIRVEFIYFLVVLIGMASSFEGPARSAFLPSIVKPETFSNAVTVNNIFQKLGSVSGPALAGLIIAVLGIAAAYSVYVACILTASVPLLMLRYQWSAPASQRISMQAVKEGVRFVREHQILLGSMSLDMFAVIFGGATALLPIYASDILHAGATGFGILTSSMQAGAFLVSFVLVMRPPAKRTGRALVWTIVVYGILTMAFGLSREFIVSVILYALIGAADQVSVVMRQTTIQMATPDELRGRVSSVHQVFTGASAQIGAIESGFVAALTTATFAVVSGGAGAIAIAGLIGWRMPQLYNYEVRPGDRVATLTRTKPETALEAEEAPVGGGGGS